MKHIHEIETNMNPFGIFDLCMDDDNCLLAYPYPDKPSNITNQEHESLGRVVIMDAYNLQTRTIIIAHDSLLQCIAFNAEGNLLATSSIMGTLIRVFSIPSGKHLQSYRRGTYPTKIQSLAFNPTSYLLACSSATDTIHIFDLRQPQTDQPVLQVVSDYIPQAVKIE